MCSVSELGVVASAPLSGDSFMVFEMGINASLDESRSVVLRSTSKPKNHSSLSFSIIIKPVDVQ
jgi:hypothetical protein